MTPIPISPVLHFDNHFESHFKISREWAVMLNKAHTGKRSDASHVTWFNLVYGNAKCCVKLWHSKTHNSYTQTPTLFVCFFVSPLKWPPRDSWSFLFGVCFVDTQPGSSRASYIRSGYMWCAVIRKLGSAWLEDTPAIDHGLKGERIHM